MTCTGGRLARFLQWRVFRPSPVMSTVTRLKSSLTQNPYEAVVVDAPQVRFRAVPFAVSATVAFELSLVLSTGNPLSVYIGTLASVLQNVVPTFVFAFLVGRFNGVSNTVTSTSIALLGRLLGGCILGVTAIPVNHMIVDYLYLVPLPRKLTEVSLVVLIPVLICTIAERMFLRVLGQEHVLGGTRNGSPGTTGIQ